MTKKVYTLGYVGRTPQQLKQLTQDLGLIILDIRFSPRSRALQWTKKRLQEVLGMDRYIHVKALGNENYKNGGEIKLVNYEAGRRIIEGIGRPVALMCGCKDYHTCHRATVAEALRRDGFEVEEIPLPEPEKPVKTVSKPRPASLRHRASRFDRLTTSWPVREGYFIHKSGCFREDS